MAYKTITLQEALAYFEVTLEQLHRVLAEAMAHGATYADIYFEHTVSNNLRMTDSKVDSASQQVEYGAGVRVVSGDHTGYAYTETPTFTELLRAARIAARIARTGSASSVPQIMELPQIKSRYPIVSSWKQMGADNRIPYLMRFDKAVRDADHSVTTVAVNESDGESIILFANSLGQAYADTVPMAMFGAQCVMERDGQREQGSVSRSYHIGAEFLSNEMIDALAAELIGNTAVLFEAVRPKGGEMPVVMGAGASGILLHEAIGHAFEADFNRLGTSIFSDRMGDMICSPLISVVDDGTRLYDRGAVNYDDEGVEGQKTFMVTEGRLTSYLHDRISARHYGVEPTGNGRRESFRSAPIPRMRSTYMMPGPHTAEEIISSVNRGVYVDCFANGQVQIGAGDFTFYVKSGRLIENGRLTQYIKDINVIGNGPEALAAVTMVGNDLKVDPGSWTCGKEGQNCPVSCGMPTVLVSSLVVGGE